VGNLRRPDIGDYAPGYFRPTLSNKAIAVLPRVAIGTECNQILRSVIPQLISSPQVMHLQVSRRPTMLAPPAISGQDLVAELFVGRWIKL